MVQEVFYAKKLIIGQTNNSIVKASMNPSKLAPVGALPVDLQGKVEVSKSIDETYVFTAPEGGRFPIGFKCIRLAYYQNGELQTPGGASFDMGEQRPKLRADVDAWLNPDKYSEFHMGDLLITREPGGPMECLPIVADDEGGEDEEEAKATASLNWLCMHLIR